MKTHGLHEHRPALERAALVDAARRRALELRSEAINAFWSALARSLRDASRLIRRNGRPGTISAAQEVSICPR